jgi:hypothetical protein
MYLIPLLTPNFICESNTFLLLVSPSFRSRLLYFVVVHVVRRPRHIHFLSFDEVLSSSGHSSFFLIVPLDLVSVFLVSLMRGRVLVIHSRYIAGPSTSVLD